MNRPLLIKQLGSTFLFAFTLVQISVASDTPLIIQTELKNPSAADSQIIQVGVVENLEQLEAAKKHLKTSFASALLKNPKLARFFRVIKAKTTDLKQTSAKELAEAVAEKKSEVVTEELSEAALAPSKKSFPNWFKKNGVRLSFTLIQGVLSGAIETWLLIVSNELPPEASMVSGMVTAALCSAWTWSTPQIAKMVEKPLLVQKIFKRRESVLFKGANWMEGLAKYFFLEVGYLATLEGVMSAFGHGPDGGFLNAALVTLGTAGLATLSEGFWDVGLLKMRERDLIKNEKSPFSIEMRTYGLGLMASLATIYGEMSSILGFPFGEMTLYATAAAGLVNLMVIEKATLVNLWHDAVSACKNLFKKRVSENRDLPLSRKHASC